MVLSSFLEEKNFRWEKYNVFFLVEQFNHCHPYQIREKISKMSKMFLSCGQSCVRTDQKPKQEKSFAGIKSTRLRFYIYFVKRQVLSGVNTVLEVEFIECDETCYS